MSALDLNLLVPLLVGYVLARALIYLIIGATYNWWDGLLDLTILTFFTLLSLRPRDH
jgi:hypothetical protein